MNILARNEVLLVDDKPETMEAFVQAIEASGRRVVYATSHSEALRLVEGYERWLGFGIIDVRMRAETVSDLEESGFAIGRAIRRTFGETALFAYATVLPRVVSLETVASAPASSRLGIVDKFQIDPAQLAEEIAIELREQGDSSDA